MKKEEMCVHVRNDNQVNLIQLEPEGTRNSDCEEIGLPKEEQGFAPESPQRADRSPHQVALSASFGLCCRPWKEHWLGTTCP